MWHRLPLVSVTGEQLFHLLDNIREHGVQEQQRGALQFCRLGKSSPENMLELPEQETTSPGCFTPARQFLMSFPCLHLGGRSHSTRETKKQNVKKGREREEDKKIKRKKEGGRKGGWEGGRKGRKEAGREEGEREGRQEEGGKEGRRDGRKESQFSRNSGLVVLSSA